MDFFAGAQEALDNIKTEATRSLVESYKKQTPEDLDDKTLSKEGSSIPMATSCGQGSNAAATNTLKNTPGCDSGNSVSSKVSCYVAISCMCVKTFLLLMHILVF